MDRDSATKNPPRQRRALNSAGLTSGAEQVIDFMLPLYAGASLELSAFETGLLVAATQGVAFAVRPLVGAAADRWERAFIAAAGTVLLAVASVLFALSGALALALVAAAATGVGSALFWVAVGAIIAEGLSQDSGIFARLMAAEETGGWVILVPAIFLASIVGYQWVFAGIAACCVAGAVVLIGAGARPVSDVAMRDGATTSFAGLVRRLRPMLLAVAVTMAAEAAIALLLLLHLQRTFGLGVVETALVFLPGSIAMGFLPPVMHRLVIRYGRRRVLIFASLASAGFAAGLAFAPSPTVIAVLWVPSAGAWAVIFPVQQAVITEAAGSAYEGRAISLYEAAVLLGAFIGSLLAGAVFEAGSWLVACLSSAVVIATGAVLVPCAVRRLAVADRPTSDAAPTSDND